MVVLAAPAAAKHHAAVHLSAAKAAAVQTAVTDHALSAGFAKGYEVSAGIALLALIITVVAIRVKRSDLARINPVTAPAGSGGAAGDDDVFRAGRLPAVAGDRVEGQRAGE
jgi:hypothetical protein